MKTTIPIAVCLAVFSNVALAGDAGDFESQSFLWNDSFGDGKDRWKTGGISQSVIVPEDVFSVDFFAGRDSALEVNARALVITPDNTASTKTNPNDRPYAQYAGLGLYVRSAEERTTLEYNFLKTEDRVGVEIGWQGDPLPLFDIQEAVHGASGMDGNMSNPSDVIDGELLVNVEGRRTMRLHMAGVRDFEIAPYVQGSAGMREVSLRAGADVFYGTSLEGRAWSNDLSTGALMGGNSPSDGFDWAVFAGADVGYVAWDAFLDGGFADGGRNLDKENFVARARAGVMVEYDQVSVGFSINWLGKEFESQPEGQVIGALHFNIKF